MAALYASLLLLAGGASVYALSPLPTQFVMDYWGSRAGLPEESVFALTQTRDGYLWLGTANGLVRYDGYAFRTYAPGKALDGAVKQAISGTAPGSGNALWIYSTGLGLVHLENNVFQPAPKFPAPCQFAQLLTDRNETFVLCSERLLRIERERVTEIARNPGNASSGFLSVARDGTGAFWVGSAGGRLTRWSAAGAVIATYGSASGVPPVRVLSILPERPDRVWIATDNGLGLLEGGRVRLFTTRDGLTTNKVRRLTLGRDGTLWVGTDAGLHLYHDGRLENFCGLPELPSESVQAILQDREDNIWIAFYETSGVFRLRKPKFLSWGMREGLASKRPYAVLKDGDLTWLAGVAGLQFLRDGVMNGVPLGPDSPGLVSLETDAAGRVWALGRNQAFVIDRQTLRSQRVPLPPDTGRLFTLNRDRQGRIRVITEKGIWIAEDLRLRPVPVAGLPPLSDRADLRQSGDGRLWLTVSGAGLFEIRDGSAVRIPLGKDPELDRIHTFYIDSANDFWLGFDGGGLARWRNGALARYGQKPGEPANFIYQLGEDLNGNFWAGLRAGLLRIRKSELNGYLDGKRGAEPATTVFNSGDGLPSCNFGLVHRTVPSAEPANVLWFGHLTGVARIDSRQIATNHLPPPVHLLEVLADDRQLPVREGVAIPPGTAMLGFSFSIPSLVDNENMQIRYRLDPFDGSWQTNDSRSVVYLRPPPGKYTFTVTASNNDGVWNEQGARLKLTVLPRFYQTWWFSLLIPAALAAMVAAMFRWRTMLLRGEKEQLEQGIADRTEELAAAKQVAENAARVKSDFLATMSHEIRTPMHGVLGNLELLSGTTLDCEQRDYLDTARKSSNSLLGLLNEVLDLSKLEAGRMVLRLEPFSLRQTVTEVARLMHAAADLKHISISVSYADRLPEHFDGDEMRIRQILSNLAGNAVKFTDKGEVSIRATGRRQADDLWRLQLEIRDTGIGIPQDRLPDLFQNFSQVNAPGAQPQGTGLGLAICRRLATLMGGSIEVTSELGRGSVFSFIVALLPAVVEPAASGFTDGNFRRKFSGRVLVAEDNTVNQKLAKALLERLGCEVTLAPNGRRAVELAERSPFSIIFMDCQMPEMDGFAASREIRARLGAAPVIVAMTANALPGDREQCLAAGMNDYISKPFRMSDLARILNIYLPVTSGNESIHSNQV